MKHLALINPDNLTESDIQDWERRVAARAVVFDEDGKIGLLHVTKRNYYKLPGGGVDPGESVRQALDRECEEELGVRIDVEREIGGIIEYRTEFRLHQISYCFLASTTSPKGSPTFTQKERDDGFEVVWVHSTDAPKLIQREKPATYEAGFIKERDYIFITTALNQAS